jgi:tetratricopeptide (TPR) repeat protein
MSEEVEGGGVSGPEGNGTGADPVAVSLALGGASQAQADAFLEDQRSLIADQKNLVRLQAKELAHELRLRHWSLQLRHASAILKFALEVSAALIGLAVAGIIAAALWNAAHADGLVIESFSVPPDLAQRGLTGQVVAGQVLDRLAEINQATNSVRTGKSYAANWGDDIKVEIPDTGISVAEVYRFLRRWLGHESHISGAVWHGQGGIVITVRSEGHSITVTGPEADLDGPIRKTAEAVFGLAEPYRYAVYLVTHGRAAESITVARQLAASTTPADRAWGLLALSRTLAANGDIGDRGQNRLLRDAALLDPGNITVINNLARTESEMSHGEAAAAGFRKTAELLGSGNAGREIGVDRLLLVQEMAAIASRQETGAYNDAIPSLANIIHSGMTGSFGGLSTGLALMEISGHDLKAARAIALDPARERNSADVTELFRIQISARLAVAGQNWPAVLAAAASAGPLLKRHPAFRDDFSVSVAPFQGYAEARLGRFAAAERLIATTPPDCDECMVQRARVAELQGQHARADWWFARAAADTPSLPFANTRWGEALLARAEPDEAIAKFTIAHQKSPRFADPLEGWGEALMAKNRSHLALVKFAEAEKYAPNWGRLHLKWGEALTYAGKPEAAKAEFARAAQLDLAPSDRAELAARLKS